MADIIDNVLEAINIMVNNKIKDLSYDKTIRAKIIEIEKDKYICEYGEAVFDAYSTIGEYEVGDEVYVSIPMGDWGAQKNILNKARGTNIVSNVESPFEYIQKEQYFFNSGDSTYQVIANFNDEAKDDIEPSVTNVKLGKKSESISLYEYYLNSPVIYDTIGLSFNINPKGLSKYNVSKSAAERLNCTYGIRVAIYEDKAEEAKIFEYTTEDMFGNLYGFDDDIYHEVAFDISKVNIGPNTKISLSLFENGDFGEMNSFNGVEPLRYRGTKDGIIVLKDVRMFLGVNVKNYPSNYINIKLLSQDHSYFFGWSKDKSLQYKNEKLFKYCIYNKTKEVNADDIKLYYSYNDTGVWKACEEESEWGYIPSGDSVKVTPSREGLLQDRIKFKFRVPSNYAVTAEDESIKKWIESDEVECVRYLLNDSYIEQEQSTCLKLQYQYTDGYDLVNYANPSEASASHNPTGQRTSFEPINEDDSIKYVGFDNILRSRVEAYSPHFIHALWEPEESILKEPTYLAGATITWKVPCPAPRGETETDESWFERNSKSVIMPAAIGLEISEDDDVKYYIDEVGHEWLELKYTFSKDFEYTTNMSLRTLNTNRLPQDYWNTIRKDMSHLTWKFRVKEQYLSSMKNNIIYCTITQSQYTFTSSFGLPITSSSEAKAGMPRVIRADFEPFDIKIKYNEGKISVEEQQIPFCVYFDDYGKSESLNIYTGFEVDLFRKFYNSDLVTVEKVGDWGFVLKIKEVKNKDRASQEFTILNNLCLYPHNEGRGVKYAFPVPLVADKGKIKNYGNAYCMISGNNRLYVKSTEEFIEEESKKSSLYTNKEMVFFPKNSKDFNLWCNASFKRDLELRFYTFPITENNNENLAEIYTEQARLMVLNKVAELSPEGDNSYKYEYPILDNRFTDELYSGSCLVAQAKDSVIVSVHDLRTPARGVTGEYTGEQAASCSIMDTLTGANMPVVVNGFTSYSDTFNAWDGRTTQIGDNYIYSASIAAGRKNNSGQFSGVIMGHISETVLDAGGGTYGMYGYDRDAISFKLTQDGKAAFGKKGNGQILIDGNSSTIQSASFERYSKGMLMDLDDGIIKMVNKINSDTVYSLVLNTSDKNLEKLTYFPLKVGKGDDDNVDDDKWLFAVNWQGKMFAKDAEIGDGKGRVIINGEEGIIQSQNNITTEGQKGISINIATGKIALANKINGKSYYLSLDATDGNSETLEGVPIAVGTGTNQNFKVNWSGKLFSKDAEIGDGKGKIILNGTEGKIQSQNYIDNQGAKGIMVDVAEGKIALANTIGNVPYYLSLDATNANTQSVKGTPIVVGTGTDQNFKVAWDGTLYCTGATIKDATIENASISVLENGELKTLIDSLGNVSQNLKFPSDFKFHSLIITDGGLSIQEGNLTMLKGDLTMANGDFKVSVGTVDLVGTIIKFPLGEISLASGITLNGDISISGGKITTSGNIAAVDVAVSKLSATSSITINGADVALKSDIPSLSGYAKTGRRTVYDESGTAIGHVTI